MNSYLPSAPMTLHRYFPAGIAVLLSGTGWYWGDHLNGHQGWLMWIAPIPVLIFSFRSTAKPAFAAAFLAYLVGRLGFFAYLTKVIPLPIAVLVTLLQPLIIAGIVLATRRIVLAKASLLAVFAFPALWTTFEFLTSLLSADGTAASIAYSQMNYLPLIQIAALTGIGGITFFITLLPSAVAVAWQYRQNKPLARRVLGLPGMICLLSASYGWFRLSASSPDLWKVGLVVLAENQHHYRVSPLLAEERQPEKKTVDAYLREVHHLARQGAKWVVLPERAINIDAVTQDSVIGLLQGAARLDRVGIVVGITHLEKAYLENESLVISPAGSLISTYKKSHLVRGHEDRFKPGNQVSQFTDARVRLGTAICKDLDFPAWMRHYRTSALLFVPAWDFVVDGWLHSRMAFLRGVENGYGQVRAARLGRLSIVDYRGRVLAEASCEQGQQAILVGRVPLSKIQTFYSLAGDWFGWLCTLAAVAFLAGRLSSKGN